MKTFLAALSLSLCLCAQGQVAIYKYTETGTITGDSDSFRVLYTGYIILDLQSGALSGIQTLPNSRQYMDLDLSTLIFTTIHSRRDVDYSLFHDAFTSTNSDVVFSWFKGVNSRLNIGDSTPWSIPRSLSMTERWVYTADDEEQQFEEDSGTMVIDFTRTFASNREGDDASAAADRVKEYLQSRGYTESP